MEIILAENILNVYFSGKVLAFSPYFLTSAIPSPPLWLGVNSGMDNFQRTKETRLCLWSEKKGGGFQLCGNWFVRSQGAVVGGGLSGSG